MVLDVDVISILHVVCPWFIYFHQFIALQQQSLQISLLFIIIFILTLGYLDTECYNAKTYISMQRQTLYCIWRTKSNLFFLLISSTATLTDAKYYEYPSTDGTKTVVVVFTTVTGQELTPLFPPTTSPTPNAPTSKLYNLVVRSNYFAQHRCIFQSVNPVSFLIWLR